MVCSCCSFTVPLGFRTACASLRASWTCPWTWATTIHATCWIAMAVVLLHSTAAGCVEVHCSGLVYALCAVTVKCAAVRCSMRSVLLWCRTCLFQGELDVIIDLVNNLESARFLDFHILSGKPRSANALTVRPTLPGIPAISYF